MTPTIDAARGPPSPSRFAPGGLCDTTELDLCRQAIGVSKVVHRDRNAMALVARERA
jgi:hypothetical protein